MSIIEFKAGGGGLQQCVNPFDRSDDVSDQPNGANFAPRPPPLPTPGTPFLESAEEVAFATKPERQKTPGRAHQDS
jgi:hypothetical protein